MKRVQFILTLYCFSSFFCFSQNKDLNGDQFLIVIDIQEYYTKGKLSEGEAQKLIDSACY